MNSEELEVSLRTEFESYLKDVFAEIRQEVSQLQEKLDAELERHKSELDSVFSNVLSRVENSRELDAGFKDTVVEHLRLAKDEGARITATAIAQAEELEKESAAPSVGIKEIHEAVADISNKQTQAEILKTLVQHAGQFASRGAFFIIKNDHLVGWRVFGSENYSTDEKLREVFLPLSGESVLSESVKSLQTIKNPSSSYADDAELFSRLEFKDSAHKVAIPLVARGRGVAVLYADGGDENKEVNAEALETLVKVAGLTVEVLASAKGTAPKREVVRRDFQETEAVLPPVVSDISDYAAENQNVSNETEPEVYESNTQDYNAEPTNVETASLEPQPFYVQEPSIAPSVAEAEPTNEVESGFISEEPPTEVDEVETTYAQNDYSPQVSDSFTAAQFPEEAASTEASIYEPNFQTENNFAYQSNDWSANQTETQDYSAQQYAESFARETDPSEYAKDFSYQPESYSAPEQTEESKDFSFQPVVETNSYIETTTTYEFEKPSTEAFETYQSAPSPEAEQFKPEESFASNTESSYGSFEQPSAPIEEQPSYSFEPVAPPVAPAVSKTRLSERNVDLPIEVSEDERRLHNDARRFARLLVSEIKLYNEQKVKEGRESSDLYDRLREAIDRSREMYDKRVQPPVAAKFDYFHYELVNTLAEGDTNKLGAGYPGDTVR